MRPFLDVKVIKMAILEQRDLIRSADWLCHNIQQATKRRSQVEQARERSGAITSRQQGRIQHGQPDCRLSPLSGCQRNAAQRAHSPSSQGKNSKTAHDSIFLEGAQSKGWQFVSESECEYYAYPKPTWVETPHGKSRFC